MEAHGPRRIALAVEEPIWNRFFLVAPLVLVGSRTADGTDDLAPKHMAMPLGWQNYFGFVCSPRHATWRNVADTGEFTVSYPLPGAIVETSMAAATREPDDSKPTLAALETFPAEHVGAPLVRHSYLWLECRHERTIDGFGENGLIVGRVVAAAVDERALRSSDDEDDADLIGDLPMLAYLSPGRIAHIAQTYAFPYPAHFRL